MPSLRPNLLRANASPSGLSCITLIFPNLTTPVAHVWRVAHHWRIRAKTRLLRPGVRRDGATFAHAWRLPIPDPRSPIRQFAKNSGLYRSDQFVLQFSPVRPRQGVTTDISILCD